MGTTQTLDENSLSQIIDFCFSLMDWSTVEASTMGSGTRKTFNDLTRRVSQMSIVRHISANL